MAANSKIEWTEHTFNPWIGCTKVSEGCKHCYAETLMDRRYGRVQWGWSGTRVRTSDANWREPLKWDKAAEAAGVRHRVFCASLADVFEGREELDWWRQDLWALIGATPNLDWLLLTKRPENVGFRVPMDWLCLGTGWPSNVWIGTSIENQQAANERIPHLHKVPASVRFLSVEPLLGPIVLQKYFAQCRCGKGHGFTVCPNTGGVSKTCEESGCASLRPMIDWVIVGGESGPGARPMHPEWVRSIRDQCRAAGVPFFFKQWGEFAPDRSVYGDPDGESDPIYDCHDQYAVNLRGHAQCMIPADDRQREWIECQPDIGSYWMAKVGKKSAGRLLDGREWNEVPA